MAPVHRSGLTIFELRTRRSSIDSRVRLCPKLIGSGNGRAVIKFGGGFMIGCIAVHGFPVGIGKRLEFFLGYFRIGYGIHESRIDLSLRDNLHACSMAGLCHSLTTLAIDRMCKDFRCRQKKLPH